MQQSQGAGAPVWAQQPVRTFEGLHTANIIAVKFNHGDISRACHACST
jgi:hypothetical protein